MGPEAFAALGDGVAIRVRLTPSGGADRVEGEAVDAAGIRHVKARVRTAPEDGKANAALEALLAQVLGAPKSAVRVARGATARLKIVHVTGVDVETARAALGGD